MDEVTDGLLYLIVYGFILFLFLEKKNKLISLLSILFLFGIKIYFYKFWGILLNPSAQMYDANILQRITEIYFLQVIFNSLLVFDKSI